MLRTQQILTWIEPFTSDSGGDKLFVWKGNPHVRDRSVARDIQEQGTMSRWGSPPELSTVKFKGWFSLTSFRDVITKYFTYIDGP